METDKCNKCFSIALKLSDPTIPEEEKDELREQLKIHIKEANIQRRAMNAFIEAIKKEKAPEDPPLRVEPSCIPEVQDEDGMRNGAGTNQASSPHPTKMVVVIEYYGRESPLPSFKQNRPGAEYFNSNLCVRNMNIISPTQKGPSKVYL